jgi:hypothetical protein
LIGALLWLRSLLIVCVLTILLCLGLRSLLLLGLDRGRAWSVVLARLVSAFVFGALATCYFLFAARLVTWSLAAVSAALVTAAVLLGSLLLRPRSARPPRVPGPLAAVSQLSMLLGLLLLAALTLMNAGFLALTEDRPALLVDVTGEVRPQLVRWAAPGQTAREETITEHRVVFRTPEGAAVADAWIYGDQVAVKGRVLRLSPMLNAAGVPNLFELQFAHNGYLTAERHSTQPHLAVPLPPSGPLAVHPWWRPLQTRLLAAWEKASPEGSRWAIRSVSSESTYYPLVDASGRPVRETYRLVLTPGGLSSS